MKTEYTYRGNFTMPWVWFIYLSVIQDEQLSKSSLTTPSRPFNKLTKIKKKIKPNNGIRFDSNTL